ncbi:lamin tail domain-containing protein [Pimelobacter sp. 30-1]|uniref:lamin tail domain-containing protein n=1 Tax=Pimelobacter sp. 30-1 TaxID=2004991 RepID=UPI001C05BC1F|nr:lamin tail domain-containing protein [Pimelobacter sp. 30-1]
MRSTPRLTGLLAAATLLVPVPLVLSTTAPAQAAASDVQITEWAYNGSEFVEITNTGSDPVDLTGWSFDDSSRTAGAFPIGSLGTLRAGESAIISEATAAAFRAEWDLPIGVKVVGDNDQNLGRSDEMNIYDAGGTLVDRLTYDDQTGLGPRTDLSSAWVPDAAALAHPDATGWTLSTAGDAEGSWTSAGNHHGSPGVSTHGGASTVRITEWEYNGSEFFEITNLGAGPAALTGWSYNDSARTPNAVSLSPLGTLARGESAVVSEATAEAFRAEWDLPATVKVLGSNPVNLGRSDEINIHDAAGALVDRLTYNDQGAGDVAGPRTDTASAWVPEAALGANRASAWTRSTAGDAEGSWTSTSAGAFVASPGTSTLGNNPPGKPGGGGTGPDPSTIKLNEVESNGDAVGDWVEITNTGTAPVDVSGWKVRDADAGHPFAVVPSGTTLAPGAFFALYTEFPPPGFGLGVDDSVTLYQADGTSVVDTYAWSGGHAATTYGRCPDGTGTWEVTTVPTRGAANACSPIRINEIESNDAAAGPDWVELVNLSDAPVDLAGWVLKDSGEADPTTLPTPSVVPAHGHLVVSTLAAGLGGADSVRLLDPAAKLIDSFSWTAHATQTYGRCKDGVGAFVDNVAPTPGAVNSCPGLDTQAWPGSQTVRTVDQAGTFNQDASGLVFDPEDPSTLWVAQNKAGTLTKLVKDGDGYVPAAGWSPGKNPRYADGTGAPDTEGITIGPDHAIYLAAERNNDVSGVSKNVVLRYEPGTSMNATDEWALNGLLPAVGANLGLEGITWVPDSYLTGGGLIDETTNQPYNPASYPAHGTGLYVVAVEGTGRLYVLALDQTAAVQESAHLVATIDPQLKTNAGPPGVMDVVWDPEAERLWAVCDDSCDGVSVTLKLQQSGRFGITAAYQRPVGMPNLNNEGFALAPQSTCAAGEKAVLWSDDGDTGGFSLRQGTFPCTEVSTPPTPVVNTAAPVVTGRAQVGATLTGTAGTWTPAPGTAAYQWLANGTPIARATGTRLVLTPALAGKRISLRVAVTADGFLEAAKTSSATAPVAAGTLALAGRPKITGKARVGTKVAVRLGRVSPAAKVGYAWYVDGRRIAGAKGAKLRLERKWAGHRITVKATYTAPGYAPATVTSPAVKVRRR